MSKLKDGRSKEVKYTAELQTAVLCPKCNTVMRSISVASPTSKSRIKCSNEECLFRYFEFEQPSVDLKLIYRYG